MIALLVLLAAVQSSPLEISVNGAMDGTVTAEGITVELMWEKPQAQRLTVRGISGRPVLVRVYPRLVPIRVLHKARPVARVVSDWLDSDEPQWRTVGDVLHFELLLPAGLSAGAPTFTLTGSSSWDDVKRARMLIKLVNRLRPWLEHENSPPLPGDIQVRLGSLLMVHAVKVDRDGSSEAVAAALRADLLSFIAWLRSNCRDEAMRETLIADIAGFDCVAVRPWGNQPPLELHATGERPFELEAARIEQWSGVAPFLVSQPSPTSKSLRLRLRADRDVRKLGPTKATFLLSAVCGGARVSMWFTLSYEEPAWLTCWSPVRPPQHVPIDVLLQLFLDSYRKRFERRPDLDVAYGSAPEHRYVAWRLWATSNAIAFPEPASTYLWSDTNLRIRFRVWCEDVSPKLWVNGNAVHLVDNYGMHVGEADLHKGWNEIKLQSTGPFSVNVCRPDGRVPTGLVNAAPRPKDDAPPR
jgi:hypothetical protein